MRVQTYTIESLAEKIKKMFTLKRNGSIEGVTYSAFLDSLNYLFEETFVDEAYEKAMRDYQRENHCVILNK